MADFRKKINGFYHNMPLKTKLTAWFLIIALSAIFTVGLLSFKTIYDSVLQNEIEKKAITNSIIIDDIGQLNQKIERTAIELSINDNLQDILSHNEEYDLSTTKYLISKVLYSINSEIPLDGLIVFNELNQDYSNITDVKLIERVRQLYMERITDISTSYHGLWLDPIRISEESMIIPHFRRIKDYRTQNVVGAVVILINEEQFSKVFNPYVHPGEHFIMVNDHSVTVSSDVVNWVGLSLSNYFEKGEVLDESKNAINGMIDQQDYIALYNHFPGTDDLLISITSKSIMMQAPNAIIYVTTIVMILSALLAVIISLLVSKSIAKPVSKLANTMDEANNLNIMHKFYPLYNDEVGRLARSFIDMTERLNRSITNEKEAEDRRRLAEYNALKWQINPHFLYNTLSTIVWLANKKQTDAIIDVTKSLSTLFRVGISKDSELIRIQEEIDHVESYLEIQKIRSPDQFDYFIEIDDQIKNLYIVKIILQPLVENAIYHGISNIDSNGIIRIEGKLNQGQVVLKVLDNGGCVTQHDIDQINLHLKDQAPSSNEFGIGVKNVSDRIKYYFNVDQGLRYYLAGVFTVAEIRVPVIDVLQKHDNISTIS